MANLENSPIYFVRHSTPILDRETPAHKWVLSEKGVSRAEELSKQLEGKGISAVYTSAEPKAIHTAEILATTLNSPLHTPNKNLNEHHRATVPFFDDVADRNRAILDFFVTPDECVFGEESANACLSRYESAVSHIRSQQTAPIAIVSHGTVMALYLAQVTGESAKDIWLNIQRLGTPSLAILSGQITYISSKK